jgi:hypothetical protein
MKRLVDELRLLACGLLLRLIIWIAPCDHPEGREIIYMLRQWGAAAPRIRPKRRHHA